VTLSSGLRALLLVALGLLCTVGRSQQTPSTDRGPQVLVVTLAGKLGTTELARATRALRDAEAIGCTWVVFELDYAGSIGEDSDDVASLLDRIEASPVGTIAFVKGNARMGAAELAVCCDRIYCAPRAEIGRITNPEPGLWELLSSQPEEELARRFASAREALQQRIERRKTDKLSPEATKCVLAMVDPSVQLFTATVREGGFERSRVLDAAEITALQGSGAVVIAPQKMTRPLVLKAQEAEDHGLSAGTVQSLDLLAEVLNIERSAMQPVVDDWAEHMVGWLEMLAPFLLIAGFVLILFEVKTPGVGLPGLLGVAFLGLAMFHSYLVGLAEITEILIFFLGLAAIAVEIFLLPGTLIFGGIGFLALVFALVLSRQSFVVPQNAAEEAVLLANLTNLTLMFVAVLGLGFLGWRLLPRIPWFNRVFLPPPSPSPAGGGQSGLGLADASLTALVGRTGTAATVLRPTGAMEIDGQRIDVVTEGEFVEAGTAVRVLYVQGNRVVVAAADERAGERGSVGVVLLLAILGLGLLVCEVIFVSFGVIAVLSGVSLLTAVFLAFQESTTFGVVILVAEAVLAPMMLALAFRLLPKTRFGKALILEGPSQSFTANVQNELTVFLGRTGVAITPLRPVGVARIDGKKVDVVTRGEMLDADSPIKVVEVVGNRVVVART